MGKKNRRKSSKAAKLNHNQMHRQTNNAKVKQLRIDDLMDIIQGKSQKDEAQLEHVRTRTCQGVTKLHIRNSDWNQLINRGLKWSELEAFIEREDGRRVVIGLVQLDWHCFKHYMSDYILAIDHIYVTRSRTDAELKKTFRGIVRLLSASTTDNNQLTICSRLVSTSILFGLLLEHQIKFKTIAIDCVKYIEPAILERSLRRFGADELECHYSSFKDYGMQLCETLISGKYPIAHLTLVDMYIDASMLASALFMNTGLKKLMLHEQFDTDQWSMLIPAISGMQGLESIELIHEFHYSPDWTPQHLQLMSSPSLQSIKCSFSQCSDPDSSSDSYSSSDSNLGADEQKRNTRQILTALQENTRIITLDIEHDWSIDKDMWKSQIRPILVNRKINFQAKVLVDATIHGAALAVGRMLCHDYGTLNANLLFKLLCDCSNTIKALWDSGRKKRVEKIERDFYDSATQYMEMMDDGMDVVQDESGVLLASREIFCMDIVDGAVQGDPHRLSSLWQRFREALQHAFA